MEKVVYAADYDGKEAWCEVKRDFRDGIGAKVEHILFRGEVELFQIDEVPFVRVCGAGSYMTTPAEFETVDFVIWDEKPEEPYFKDGYPDWEIHGE